ncbi:hypothetical protein [Nonomuraea sp. NPDC049028]|uniref:hypothetical protein n=1 Tax=Nonomuraea sp. NPDC049028 TaxID=3364348 RepID=UPI003710730E
MVVVLGGLGSGLFIFLSGFAGLQCDRVRGEGAGPQRGGQAGDQMLGRDVTGQEQHFDQRAGAVAVAMGLASRRILATDGR